MIEQKYFDGLPDPLDIIKKLDRYVVGQDQAKKNLGVLVLVRALMRLQKNNRIRLDYPIQKSNLLLIGPTGSGKTQLIKALDEIMDIPILIKDVTGITSAGYYGGNVSDILFDYVNKHYNYMLTYKIKPEEEEMYVPAEKQHIVNEIFLDNLETGIIYLDEIDKLAGTRKEGASIVSTRIQNELLKILEGESVGLVDTHGHRPLGGLEELNTKYITFICGGAFAGLDEIINTRLSKKAGIGFNSKISDVNMETEAQKILKYIETKDLVQYGFKEEFLGRLPLRAVLDSLSIPMMIKIITEPKNAIYKRYQEFFRLFGFSLTIENEGLDEIAKRAIELNLGARSLQQIFNDLFIDDLAHVFDIKSLNIKISKQDIIERLK